MATVGLGPAANGWSTGSKQIFGEDAFNTPTCFSAPTFPIGRYPFAGYGSNNNINGFPPLHFLNPANCLVSGTVSAPFFLSMTNYLPLSVGLPPANNNLYTNILTGSLGFNLYYSTTGTYIFGVQDSGTSSAFVTIETNNIFLAYTYPSLHHIIVTYQPVVSDIGSTNIDQRMAIYVNGILQPTSLTSATFPVTQANVAATNGAGSYSVGIGGTTYILPSKVIENYGNINVTQRVAWQIFSAAQRYLPPNAFIAGSPVIAIPTFSLPAFEPPLAPVNNLITIMGNNFTGTTSVLFNGVSASFTIYSNTIIEATIPAGATTGVITVINASGTAVTINQIIVAPVWAAQVTSNMF